MGNSNLRKECDELIYKYKSLESEINLIQTKGEELYQKEYDNMMRTVLELRKKADLLTQNKEPYKRYIDTVHQTYKRELSDEFNRITDLTKRQANTFKSEISSLENEIGVLKLKYERTEKEDPDLSYQSSSVLKKIFTMDLLPVSSIERAREGKKSNKSITFLISAAMVYTYIVCLYLILNIIVTTLKQYNLFSYDIPFLPVPSPSILFLLITTMVVAIIISIVFKAQEIKKIKNEDTSQQKRGLQLRLSEIASQKTELERKLRIKKEEFDEYRKKQPLFFKDKEHYSPDFEIIDISDNLHQLALDEALKKTKMDFDISVFDKKYKFGIAN